MKTFVFYIVVSSLLLGCTRSNKSDKAKIMVFCAASLNDVVSEIADSFEIKFAVQVNLNFASSGTLARQIENGAVPSLFISANKKWVSYLNEIGKTNPELDRKLAENELVIVTPVKSPIDTFVFSAGTDFPDRFQGRLSIGDPKHVPAGEYATQAINAVHLYEKLKTRLLPAKDVRSALMVVELGEAEAGIVYKTDALKSQKVKIAAEIPDSLHQPIEYYVSVLKNKDENTKLFYAFLYSETSNNCLLKNGFKVD